MVIHHSGPFMSRNILKPYSFDIGEIIYERAGTGLQIGILTGVFYATSAFLCLAVALCLHPLSRATDPPGPTAMKASHTLHVDYGKVNVRIQVSQVF